MLAPAAQLIVKLSLALLADRLLGEPRRWHPLVGFGRWAQAVEQQLRRWLPVSRASGVLGWLLAVLPWLALLCLLRGFHPWLAAVLDVLVLYLALGGRSLVEHLEAVAAPLSAGDLPRARERVGWIVSRDTSAMSEADIARAATESALENGNDAIFGAIFCFVIGGAAGALIYRLANTLDAMWGYRNERYRHFGWAAARIDDLLNFFPARLTALSYCLLGQRRAAWRCWQQQAGRWVSPNAGAVMAAGGGALGVQLGGPSYYHGELQPRPELGCGAPPNAASLHAAIRLVRHSLWLWYGLIVAGAALLLLVSEHA